MPSPTRPRPEGYIGCQVKIVLTKRETGDSGIETYIDKPQNRRVCKVNTPATQRSHSPTQKSQQDDGDLLSPTNPMEFSNPLSPLNPANTWDKGCTDSLADTTGKFSCNTRPMSLD